MRTNRPRRGRLVSIGYEGRSLRELLDVLDNEGVHVLVDVREHPVSRKPGLSRSALESALASIGVEYRHEPLLGNPRTNREAFRNGDASARRRFVKRLENGSRNAFDQVAELARRQVVALLCFERAHSECHRSAIVDVAKAKKPDLRVVTI